MLLYAQSNDDRQPQATPADTLERAQRALEAASAALDRLERQARRDLEAAKAKYDQWEEGRKKA